MNPGSSQNYLIDVDAPDRASAEMLAHTPNRNGAGEAPPNSWEG